ncbi:hypothetical protein FKM82_020683 [Ascaphus truei]
MSNWLTSALPNSTKESLNLDRCQRALRSRPQPGDRPRDMVLRFHYFKTKEAFRTVMRYQRSQVSKYTPTGLRRPGAIYTRQKEISER